MSGISVQDLITSTLAAAMMTSRTNTRTLISGALVCWLAAGCSHYKPLPLREPATDDETGRVEVSVVSSVPFEALRSGFDPGFELKSADALLEALVTTQATQTTVNKATQLLISAAIPGAAASAPGAIASAPMPKAPETLSAAGTPPATAAVSQHNAMLRYQLAASLLQEVAMLNSYVRDAPRRAGYDPFVVRLKVTVRPQAHATPFDMQSNISFHAKAASDVVAVPLLASDSEDATSASSLDRRLAQFGLAVSALQGAYGLGGQFAHNAEDIVTSLGWHYQNVSNVARIDDRTLSLRVNAQPTGVNRFELTSRTHYVTALLLVKRPAESDADSSDCLKKEDRPCAKLSFQASTQFIHATTGKAPGEAPGQSGRSAARVQPGDFEVYFWPDPVLPPSGQLAPLLIAGDKAPYTATLKLRGGNNLTKSSVLRATLQLPEGAATPAPLPEKGAKGPLAKGAVTGQGVPALLIAASKIDTAPKSRDTLLLEFSDLSKASIDRLKGSPQLRIELALGADARRAIVPSSIQKLTITPDVTDLDPEETPFLSTVKADGRLTVSPEGSGELGVAVKWPERKNAGAIALVQLAFEGAVPAGLKLHAGATPGCATIDKGGLAVRGTCSFDVALRNLPLPPQATPVSLKLSATEYAAPEVKRAEKPLSVSLQYPVHRPGCRDCGAAK